RLCLFAICGPPALRLSLFPYTTLFRSAGQRVAIQEGEGARLISEGKLRCAQPSPTAKADARDQKGEGGCVQPSWNAKADAPDHRSEEHTSELQSRENLVCRLLLGKKNQ